MRAIGTVRPEQGFQQFAGFVVIRILLRQRYQIQLVFLFRCFHVIKVTHLLHSVKCFCDTFIVCFLSPQIQSEKRLKVLAFV